MSQDMPARLAEVVQQAVASWLLDLVVVGTTSKRPTSWERTSHPHSQGTSAVMRETRIPMWANSSGGPRLFEVPRSITNKGEP